ncbi:sodium:proton antiporter [Orenia marismortui]|uniref:Multicomponent Na+:H+ antiporter subunit C n=1 Tax=Orenia marismortui TaxID=46469 RepID=A0A4R8GQH5_9FIRM|nr:sodium:proton antiporter [Orenia marismortui]TDX48022.1 multicomponent Na+:H+ antiporter subunit C [Orenia marismortui]
MSIIYLIVIILFSLGLYTVLTYKNLIKIIIGINIMEYSLILLLINIGYKVEGTAPILNSNYKVIVDPIPQSLALTAIVIGASITALMLFLTIKLNKKYQTLDISKIRRLKG